MKETAPADPLSKIRQRQPKLFEALPNALAGLPGGPAEPPGPWEGPPGRWEGAAETPSGLSWAWRVPPRASEETPWSPDDRTAVSGRRKRSNEPIFKKPSPCGEGFAETILFSNPISLLDSPLFGKFQYPVRFLSIGRTTFNAFPPLEGKRLSFFKNVIIHDRKP